VEARTRAVFFRAVSSAWIYRLITAACGLVVLPLVTSSLTPVEFGVWVLAGQVASFLTLADAGSGTAVSRLVARSQGAGDRAALFRVLSSTFALAAAAGLLTIPIAIALSLLLPGWLRVTGEAAIQMRNVLLIAGGSLAVQCWLRLGGGVLAGFQMYGLHAIGKILEPILTLVGVLGLLATGRLHLISLAIVSAMSVVTAQSIQLVVAWVVTRPWGLSPRRVTLDTVRQVLGLGSSLVVSSVGTLTHHQGLGLLVGRLAGVEAAGLYGLALMVMMNLQPLVSALAAPMTTLASEWEASRAGLSLQRTVASVTRLTSGLGAMVVAGALVFAEPVVRIIIPADTWSAASVHTVATGLIVMSLGVWCAAVMFPLRGSLQGTGQHWLVARLQAGGVLIGGSVAALLLAAGAGVTAAAAGWTLIWAIQWAGMARAVRQRSPHPFRGEVLWPAARTAAATLGVGLLARGLSGSEAATASTLIGIAVASAAGGITLFWPLLSREIRRRLNRQR
jgi:O-antigen/teichoic acid export membrane protein